jgi:phytoene desaturase
VFRDTYHALGEDLDQHLDLRRVDPTYRIHFDDGSELRPTRDPDAMRRQLEAIEPGSYAGLQAYLAEGQEQYRLALSGFVGRNFRSLAEYFSPANLPLLFRLRALVNHYHHIGHFLRDPRLKAAFTFQDMYLGLSPFDAPATYSLLAYTELGGGVWFPRGGLYRVVESLASVAERLGVRFRYGTAVSQIEIEAGRAVGVRLEGGARLPADVVIANADLPYVYRSLLSEAGRADQAEAERLADLKYTCSALMFYWGLDRHYAQLHTHNVFLCGDYESGFDRIFADHSLPDEPSFYVHAPSRVDPSAAPAGQDSLYVLVPAGHLDSERFQNWDELRDRARAAVLRRLEQAGLSDLRRHLKFETCFTPRDWQARFSLEKGAGFGLSHNFWQVGYLRPHNRHAHYPNLYFAGSSTHPGTGLPMVLLSAQLVVERILSELPQPAQVAA